MADLDLDAGGATPIVPAAREAMLAALEAFGDPLQITAPGRAARSLLEDARGSVAEAIGAQPDEIVFTSGGTESISLAVEGIAGAASGTVVSSAIEHPAVAGAVERLAPRGVAFVAIGGDRSGRLDLDRFATAVRAPGDDARDRPAREPRDRHDAADRRGRPGRPRGRRAVPHGCGPDRRPPPDRRPRARRSTCSRWRDTPSAGPPAWARCTCAAAWSSRPRSPGTTGSARGAPGSAEPPGDRGDGGRAHRRPRDDGRRRRRAHGRRPRPFVIGSPRWCPAPRSTGIRPTACRTSSASRLPGSTRRRSRWRWTIAGSTSGRARPAPGVPRIPPMCSSSWGSPRPRRSGSGSGRRPPIGSWTAASRCSPRWPETSGRWRGARRPRWRRFQPPDPGVAS